MVNLKECVCVPEYTVVELMSLVSPELVGTKVVVQLNTGIIPLKLGNALPALH